MSAQAIEALQQAIGPTWVLTHGDLSSWEVDWRKRYRGRALAVVRPGSTEDVAAVIRICAAHRLSVVPQGGNTSLVGGSVPDDSGSQVLLSLTRLNRIRELDATNLTLTAEAGCVLGHVQAAAADKGLYFPLSLASEGSCTIGGNLATNAGGTQVLRYGPARDLCLGLELVTPRGEVWHGLSGLRKDNTGYDLRNLHIGSEGTLGVITAATMRLFPQPAAVLTAWVSLSSLRHAVELLQAAQTRLGPGLTGFEVMNRLSLDQVAADFPALRHPLPPSQWTVLIEQSDCESDAHARALFEQLLEQALAAELIEDAAIAESIEQSRAMWHLRETIPLAQTGQGLSIKHDISLPVSAIVEFVARTDAELVSRFAGVELVNFGHLGDGNLHYNVRVPKGAVSAELLPTLESDVNTVVYSAVAACQGSISAEHGIGQLKRGELKVRKSPVAMQMMRSIKQALDPQGLLNPGRLL